jgi:hypothetical protein
MTKVKEVLDGVKDFVGIIPLTLEIGTAIAGLKLNVRPRGSIEVIVAAVVFLVLVCAAFKWCWPEGRSKILRVGVGIALGVGAVACSIFLLMGLFLLFAPLFNLVPDVKGTRIGSATGRPVQLMQNTFVADYKFEFDRDADYAEVYIRPSNSDKPRVKTLVVTGFTARTIDDKRKFQHFNTGSAAGTDVYFHVTQPSTSLTATVTFRIGLAGQNTQPVVQLITSYEYWQHNRWWRLRKWIFAEFGPQ